jgi:pilus assembly protein CpaE
MLTRLFTKGKEEAQVLAEKASNTPLLDASAEASQAVTKRVAPIVGVLGVKGGVGASTLAVNLGAAMSLAGTATTVIDANFQQPDIAQLCGQDPVHSLSELMTRSSLADRKLFEACAVELPNSKLTILSPPLNGEAVGRTNLSLLTECILNIRTFSPFWLIDLPRHLDKHLVTLTDVCDKIVLVFEGTLSSVTASQRWLAYLRALGYGPQQVLCVLNRAGSKYSGVEQQLHACFTDHTVLRIPNASAIIWESETKGTPVLLSQPSHAYSRAVSKLARHIYSSVIGGSDGGSF